MLFPSDQVSVVIFKVPPPHLAFIFARGSRQRRKGSKGLPSEVVLPRNVRGYEESVILGRLEFQVERADFDAVRVIIEHHPNLEIRGRCHRPNGEHDIAVNVLDP